MCKKVILFALCFLSLGIPLFAGGTRDLSGGTVPADTAPDEVPSETIPAGLPEDVRLQREIDREKRENLRREKELDGVRQRNNELDTELNQAETQYTEAKKDLRRAQRKHSGGSFAFTMGVDYDLPSDTADGELEPYLSFYFPMFGGGLFLKGQAALLMDDFTDVRPADDLLASAYFFVPVFVGDSINTGLRTDAWYHVPFDLLLNNEDTTLESQWWVRPSVYFKWSDWSFPVGTEAGAEAGVLFDSLPAPEYSFFASAYAGITSLFYMPFGLQGSVSYYKLDNGNITSDKMHNDGVNLRVETSYNFVRIFKLGAHYYYNLSGDDEWGVRGTLFIKKVSFFADYSVADDGGETGKQGITSFGMQIIF